MLYQSICERMPSIIVIANPVNNNGQLQKKMQVEFFLNCSNPKKNTAMKALNSSLVHPLPQPN